MSRGRWFFRYPSEPSEIVHRRAINRERLFYNPRRRRLAALFWEAARYRLWGRWDDVLFYLDDEAPEFYARFGVEKDRVLAAAGDTIQFVDATLDITDHEKFRCA